MKRHFPLLILVFAFGFLNAQETYRFRTDTPQGLNVESSTPSGLSLRYALNKITIAETNYGEDRGQEIIMKSSFGSFAEGLPNLPFENHYIAIPQGATVSVKISEKGCQTLQDIALLPAAPLQMNGEDKRLALHWDANVFNKDADFPSENVYIAQTTQIRGLDVVMLSVTPFRYNPVKKTLEVIYDMDIEVRFEGGNGQFGDARYRNPAWDSILRDLVINSEMLPEAHYYERLNEAAQNREEGCEYLIISPDDPAILAWADTLKLFRTRQGILTKVVTLADCGGNEPDSIRNFLLNVYENWAIPPAAVLLFGGNHATNPEFGPKPYFFTSPVSWGQTYTYPTDNPFADMNGDSIPDLAISRMTIYNASDCQQQVTKLIDYELNPPTDPHYYDNPVINSGYQETKWFAITAQITNNFFRDKLGKHPTNLYMKYWFEDYDPTPPDSIWSTAPNTDAVLDYFGPNGAQYIPSSIVDLDDWIDMLDKQPFQNAVNGGSFMTFYRDHSNPDWWCCSNIESIDLPSFHNERPTFLFPIGCSTNHYWNDWSYDNCIAELFLQAPQGAIGSLGANTVTYSHYNDLTTWGMFDYFWPNYMPTLGSQTEAEFSYPSYALIAGKLFLRQQTFLPYTTDTAKVEKTLNLFSFLGETYLDLYTEVPQQIAIEAAAFHPYNQQEYTFTAEEDATVCLSYGDAIIQVVRATGQPQAITLPPMEIGDQFVLTVTKQNHFRHEQTVHIISNQQAWIYLKEASVDDQNGNGQLDYGEYADISLHLQNAVNLASDGATVTLHCESPYIEILQGSAHYPNIEAGGSLELLNAFRVRIANNVPDQSVIPFTVHFDEGQNTHDDTFIRTINAPIIAISPEFLTMTGESLPSTHIATEGNTYVVFTFGNIGHATAEHPSATLDIKAPFVSVATPFIQLDNLAPDESTNLVFELNTTPNDIEGAWLQSQLEVNYGGYRSIFDTIIQYGGVFEDFESDTLNPRVQWANQGNYSWVYCDEDAYEGNRCFISRADTILSHQSLLRGRLKKPWVYHRCKLSFQYKTDEGEQLRFKLSGEDHLSSEEWKYAEYVIEHSGNDFSFGFVLSNSNSVQAKIDNICLPPSHTTIAYTGDDLIACNESTVELKNAYAYDCDSILWITEGDGHFDCDTIANPTYFPGSQDLANGSATLTLTAFGNDTIVSSIQIRFVDGIDLGAIVGDNIVNKYENQVSQYSIEHQEGMNFVWQLVPAEAGVIYDHDNAIDIVWNQHEGDAEVVLSVKADNGCDMEPSTKTISLIGYDIPEWSSVSFDLFPNPTDGKVNLIVGETLQGKAVVEVYNLLGERMMTKNISHLQKNETLPMDLGRFVSGLYIIKLSTENGSCTKKVSVR